VTGVVFCITTIILISGGRERVSGFSSVIIPILSVCYVVFSLAILFVNARMIPGVFSQVLREGTNVSAMSGGLFGFLTSKAVRLGASRGILSNEAGCGTASYAQDPNESDVASGAVWGVIEVIVDTLLLCSLTALVLLAAPSGNSEPMKSVIDSYSFFGEIGGYFIGISAGMYGLSYGVCWSYYGRGAVKHLGGKKRACILYVIIYSIAGLLGSVFKSELVWDISDLTVSVMAIFNTVCVILLSGKVKKRTEECFS
jgi:AGCS family alanine or glycine:cation symporter